MSREVDRLIRGLEEGLIARPEFFNSMLAAVEKMSAEEKQSILGVLAGHNSETVREEVAKVQAFVRNKELSRDFEHIQRNSPLRPGTRLELSGEGNDSSSLRPLWLRGQNCRSATFIRFESQGENLTPVAFVEFDESIDIPGHRGRYGVLFARYGSDSAAWALPEGSVGMCVVQALPSAMDGFCDTHPFTDKLVYYRVRPTSDEVSKSNASAGLF